MKYVIAQYNSLNPFNNTSIPIGVVLQDESGLHVKFDTSKDRLAKIQSIASQIDPETFASFAKSFEESFVKAPYIEISDDNGNKIQIKSNDPKFLDYLKSTYQTFYQFSEPKEIEGTNAAEYLDLLYKNYILP